MRKFLVSIVLVLTCVCNFLQAQVWTNLIDSVPFTTEPDFFCATVDTNANILYLGGNFRKINQFKTHTIIKYNGTVFDTLGSGMDDDNTGFNIISSMKMYKNNLYVFGNFNKAGSYRNQYMAKWNGTAWDSANLNPNGVIFASDIFNNELYVSGAFDTIGGIACNSVAKYDGTNWFSLSHPVKNNVVNSIKHYKGRLYMAGQVTDLSSGANLSYWDGQQWIPWVGTSGDVNKAIFGMTVIDSMLWVYGRFNSIAGTECKGFAAFNGKQWYGFGQGLNASSWQTVYGVEKINGEIYAFGNYDKIEGVGNSTLPNKSTNIAKFDGEKWCLISPPIDNTVIGMIKYKGNIYAYGAFNKIGNDTIRGIGKFNGGYGGAICSPTITIKASTVGLKEVLNFGGNVKIYPNPVKDRLTILLDGFERVNLYLDLINSMAEILKTQTYTDGQNEFDLTDLPKGIYFLRVRDSETQKVFKVIKE